MKALKSTIALLLAALLLVGYAPVALAAGSTVQDGAAVLTSLGHKNTDTVTVSNPSTEIVLTVAASFTSDSDADTTNDVVDLSNNIKIAYDTTLYKLVVATPSGTATVGGTAVTLDVAFKGIADGDTVAQCHTSYLVRVVRASSKPPTFNGTISKIVTMSGTIIFSATDFTAKYTQNDGAALGYIAITGSNPDFGALKHSGSAYSFGTLIPISTINALTFSASANGTVSYTVTAYAGSNTTTPIGSVVLTITAFSVPTIKTAISDTVAKGGVMTFTADYFTSHCDMSGMPLYSVEITPTSTTTGTWYYSGKSFKAATVVLAADLGNLSFTALLAGDATFTWRIANQAGYSATGTGVIAVTSPALTLTAFTSGSPILKGATWSMDASHFVYAPTTTALAYIKITTIPATGDGYLYLTTAVPKNDTYGSSAVTANTALAANTVIPAAYLISLRFATKSTTASTSASFKWAATTDLKIASASWSAAVTYTVSFVQADKIYDSTDMNLPLALSLPKVSEKFSSATGASLSYITVTLPDKTMGTLYLNYDSAAKTGTAVQPATKYYSNKTPNIANLTFVPTKDYTGNATFIYNAYSEAGSFITGTYNITVLNTTGGTFTLQTDKNAPLHFDAATFQSSFSAAIGAPLSYMTIVPPASSYGMLYYNYAATGAYEGTVSAGTVYKVSTAPYLSLITFVPANDYTGTVPIYFIGYTASGVGYSCKLNITVLDSQAGIVSYSLKENSTAAISGKDFTSEFVAVTGSILSYVTFTPPANSVGSLYYQYDAVKKTGTKVTAATQYIDGRTPDLSEITFVPAKDYVGTVIVPYKGYSAAGTAYNGKLKFIVTDNSSVISYSLTSADTITMSPGDFSNSFSSLSGGKTLSSVSFELPAASYGRLYYNYTTSSSYDSAVSTDTVYAVDSEPSLAAITFVPSASYSGTFTFSYTGYTADNASFKGKVRITVTNSKNGSVSYATTALTPVTFNAADFVAAAATSGSLQYVTFTPPYASYGTLYSGYTSAASPGAIVSYWTPYYVSASPYLSEITFVPNSSFSGTITINYTAYYTSGAATAGTVLVKVDSSGVPTITYSTVSGSPAAFIAEDFNTSFLDKTGSALNYVVFSVPDSAAGQLFTGYTAPSSYTGLVSSSTKYYKSYSPLLSSISFVPQLYFTGSISISYTGYTVSGTACSGRVIINVGYPLPFNDMKSGYDWAAQAVSYLFTSGVIRGSSDGLFYPADNVTRGDFVLMVARAFNLSSGSNESFADVPPDIYYASAISAAKSLGIINGSGDMFSPSAPLSRQDAMVILYRTLTALGIGIAPGSASDLTGFSDAYNVSDYAVTAMGTLVKAGILTGSEDMLHPKDLITRAEMATILYKVVAR